MSDGSRFAVWSVGAFATIIFLCLVFLGYPQYNVYASRLAGEAELAQAEYTKRVAVQTAQAKLDSAKLNAQTDVERAKGIAAANKLIAEGLGGPEGYLRWKYIEMLEETSGNSGRQTIYIPTEGAMPLLEAGRLKK